jgi:hypothetical protein
MLYRAFARILNTRLGFTLTRILLKPEGVFLCYPAEDRFADHFASKRRQEKNAWQPWLIGFMWQEQSSSIVFAISTSETELREASTHNLVSLVDRIEALQRSFGARRIAMAGILPSLLRARRLRHSGIEFEITCRAVARAIEKIISSVQPHCMSIVVLGGRGFIGRSLVRTLASIQNTLPVYAVDKGDELFSYSGSLYVNCTQPGFIENQWQMFPSGSVILNEVYPAPNLEVVYRLEEKGVKVFHVAGLPGIMLPRMPGEYKDAIPCCAAKPGDVKDVIVKRIILDGI